MCKCVCDVIAVLAVLLIGAPCAYSSKWPVLMPLTIPSLSLCMCMSPLHFAYLTAEVACAHRCYGCSVFTHVVSVLGLWIAYCRAHLHGFVQRGFHNSPVQLLSPSHSRRSQNPLAIVSRSFPHDSFRCRFLSQCFLHRFSLELFLTVSHPALFVHNSIPIAAPHCSSPFPVPPVKQLCIAPRFFVVCFHSFLPRTVCNIGGACPAFLLTVTCCSLCVGPRASFSVSRISASHGNSALVFVGGKPRPIVDRCSSPAFQLSRICGPFVWLARTSRRMSSMSSIPARFGMLFLLRCAACQPQKVQHVLRSG